MTVKTDKLVHMAEQIRANMAYTDDRQIVAARIADHLSRFWDPRMLAAIKAYRAKHPDELSAELSDAVASLD
jgi:formate dehydrogenase subunit delta